MLATLKPMGFVLGETLRPIPQETAHVVENAGRLDLMAFLALLLVDEPWCVGDTVEFAVHRGRITHAKVRRNLGGRRASHISASWALMMTITSVVEHGFGTTTFKVCSDDVLLHELTCLTIKVDRDQTIEDALEAVERRPGDKVWYENGVARLYRTALPVACLALTK